MLEATPVVFCAAKHAPLPQARIFSPPTPTDRLRTLSADEPCTRDELRHELVAFAGAEMRPMLRAELKAAQGEFFAEEFRETWRQLVEREFGHMLQELKEQLSAAQLTPRSMALMANDRKTTRVNTFTTATAITVAGQEDRSHNVAFGSHNPFMDETGSTCTQHIGGGKRDDTGRNSLASIHDKGAGHDKSAGNHMKGQLAADKRKSVKTQKAAQVAEKTRKCVEKKLKRSTTGNLVIPSMAALLNPQDLQRGHAVQSSHSHAGHERKKQQQKGSVGFASHSPVPSLHKAEADNDSPEPAQLGRVIYGNHSNRTSVETDQAMHVMVNGHKFHGPPGAPDSASGAAGDHHADSNRRESEMSVLLSPFSSQGVAMQPTPSKLSSHSTPSTTLGHKDASMVRQSTLGTIADRVASPSGRRSPGSPLCLDDPDLPDVVPLASPKRPVSFAQEAEINVCADEDADEDAPPPQASEKSAGKGGARFAVTKTTHTNSSGGGPKSTTFHEDNDEHDLEDLNDDSSDEESEEETRTCCSAVSRVCSRIISKASFEQFCGFLIVMNGVSIGLEVDYMKIYNTDKAPFAFRVVELALCAFFTLEICLRICADPSAWAWGQAWRWNLFDAVMIGNQLVTELCELALPEATDSDGGVKFTFLRLLRLLRLIRIMRVARLLRFVSELQLLTLSIIGSLQSLFYTLVLMFMMIYLVGVFLTQMAVDRQQQGLDAVGTEDLDKLFGSLGGTCLSLYQSILGGFDWHEMMDTIIKYFGMWVGAVFALFMAFTVLAMMNIVTGVFVDASLKNAKETREYNLMSLAQNLFQDADANLQLLVRWDDFEAQIHKPVMRDFFKFIDIDMSEASTVFELLDVEGVGVIDLDQFLSGVLGLRGPAKALQLSLLAQETRQLKRKLFAHIGIMEHQLRTLDEAVAKISQRLL
eukprot:TRINITY_DN17369_c0_g1_i1.p1 TRINITY_DN17369_c0_g1~~TRINITY_DN17369_c0_g1_i1.p1  ORF type:complete len:926 (-),score=224.00 TRINITY_DN17369_c0_g1_i1:187-2964(-)